MRRFVALAAIASSAATAPVWAGITYGTISRTLNVEAIGGPPATNASNSVEGAWNQSLFAWNPNFDNPVFNPANPPSGLVGGGGWAVQDSLAGPASVQGHLFARAWDGHTGFGGRARSEMVLTFVLDTPTPCTINGAWSTNFNGPFVATPESTFLLVGPNGNILQAGFSSMSPDVVSNTFAFSGTLQQGAYTLTAFAREQYWNLNSSLASQTMTLDFTMSIPGPATGGVFLVALFAMPRRRSGRMGPSYGYPRR